MDLKPASGLFIYHAKNLLLCVLMFKVEISDEYNNIFNPHRIDNFSVIVFCLRVRHFG